MRGITKRFGGVTANREARLTIQPGEILALLGENGSGKTTMMNMLSGLYYPDEGAIFVRGEAVSIRSPRDAFALGIGMVHQHFKLVETFTAAENILLGLPGERGRRYNLLQAVLDLQDISVQYGFDVDLRKKVYDMAVSEKQTVEILKVLYRGAEILILDEPTAVLTPQETEKLFAVLRTMRDHGKSVVIITHKLNEVMAISDRVTVLRRGAYVETLATRDATVGGLAEAMVGRAVTLDIRRSEVRNPKLRLSVEGLSCRDGQGLSMLKNVSFEAYGGEILGIAGIAGSGQRELCEAIAGLQKVEAGKIGYFPEDGETAAGDGRRELVGLSPTAIQTLGVRLAFVPEDRLGMGLVGSMGMVGNMLLKTYSAGKSFFMDTKPSRKLAEEVREKLEVSTPDVSTPVQRLSGGNVQKVLLGREIASKPSVLLAAYPVRGLDIHSSYRIYELLSEQKEAGAAVLYVGEDLDVLLELCDRILILCGGEVSALADARRVTKEEVGLFMTRLGGGAYAE
jgi:simple sugar transport system ATP-binding protein